MADYKDYHLQGTRNPAVLSECWTGGRLLHWLPYSANFMKEYKCYDLLVTQ